MFLFRRPSVLYVRNFVFGVEDSLVSTVGLLSGVAIAGATRSTIFLTGVILIFVEAFSMAVGSFFSELSAEEYEKRGYVPIRKSVAGSIIMFLSYFISGFIPLFPYVVFSAASAFWISILLSMAALFGLGSINARLSRLKPITNGARMLLIGGIAILVGVTVGRIVQNLY